jgi:hypothetical protein
MLRGCQLLSIALAALIAVAVVLVVLVAAAAAAAAAIVCCVLCCAMEPSTSHVVCSVTWTLGRAWY